MKKPELLFLSFLAIGLASKAQITLPKTNPDLLKTDPLLTPEIKPFSAMPYNAKPLAPLRSPNFLREYMPAATPAVSISPIDHMPVAALSSADRMPVMKLTGTFNMPIAPDGIKDAEKEKVKPQ